LNPHAWSWLLVGASLLACTSKPAETRDSHGSARQALITPGQRESAGLVVLGAGADAIQIGSRARLVVDRGLTNGGLDLQAEARASGDFEAAGNARLQPRAKVEGGLTLGGVLTLQPGASVTGSVQEHATLPPLAFPAAEAVAMQGGSFGALGADIVVPPGASVELGERTQQLARLVVESQGTLVVSGAVRLEVLERLTVGPQAKVVVRGGGSLTLLLRGSGELGPQSRVEQQGQSRALGLRLFVTAAGKLDLQAASHFGPGLLYYPSRDQGQPAELRPSAVSGAIVCGKLTTAPAAVLELNARYLRCALDVAPPRLVISDPAAATSVPPSQTSLDLAGRVEDDGAVEMLELSDAAGTRALSLDSAGAFSATATLRQDGEPTRVCVRAVDCAGRDAVECRVVEVESALDLAITYPAYGQRLTSASVDLRGRTLKGQLASVGAAGMGGTVSGASFTVPNVALSAGWNVIEVVGEDASGAVKRVRTAVARDTLPIRRGSLTVIGNRRVELEGFAELLPNNRDTLPASGFVHYQMLDQTGKVIFTGQVLATGRRSFHNDGPLVVPLEETVAPETGVSFYVPLLPAARQIVFTDPFGVILGQGAIP
jgi:hypothetical protein